MNRRELRDAAERVIHTVRERPHSIIPSYNLSRTNSDHSVLGPLNSSRAHDSQSESSEICAVENEALKSRMLKKNSTESVPRSEVGTSFPNSKGRRSVIRLVAVPDFTLQRCELDFNLIDEEK
jgi:hypothetical protein